MRVTSSWLFVFIFFVFLSDHTYASKKADGTFTAIRSCEAFQSFSRGTNPGFVKLEPGAEYEIVEVNSDPWSWIRIIHPGVTEGDALRWVPRECGVSNLNIAASRNEQNSASVCDTTPNTHDSNVLALSWQPGFCEHTSAGPQKPECAAMAAGELVISYFTLHGLWPNKKSCGTNYGNCLSTDLDLAEDTISTISPWMPNFFFSQSFGRHEWNKHGTCQALEDDEYFLLAIDLLKRVDQSIIGTYIRNNIGQEINVSAYEAAVKDGLGRNASENIRLLCTKGTKLQEIRIGLPKEIDRTKALNELIEAGVKQGVFRGNCAEKVYIEASGL